MLVKSENDFFKVKDKAFSDAGIIINSDYLNGLEAPLDIYEAIKILENKKLEKAWAFRLKDWGYRDKDTEVVL